MIAKEESPTLFKQLSWLNKPVLSSVPELTYEILIFSIIILLTIISRFYNLGARVMSHDESLHTYFSWQLYKGQGYQHNPMMHGPLQFHLIALSYFIFGASDFTARIPAALSSIATVFVIWKWRRYLGRAGALLAAGMALISPYLSFYGRYTREDPYVGVSLFLMLYGILRYFETGKAKYIYLISGALVIHYLTKETSFIYNAQILVYLAIFFITRITQKAWPDKPDGTSSANDYRGFIISLGIAVILIGMAGGFTLLGKESQALNAAQTAAPADPNAAAAASPLSTGALSPTMIFGGLALLAVAAAAYFLVRGFTWKNIRAERSFDLLMVFGTLVLPQLSAFPVHFMGWNSLDYSTQGIIHTAYFLVPMTLIAIGIGLWWNADVWWRMALIFYGPYLLLYTTFFTNGQGFFTGVVGSLGYWLEQQDVNRGSQPWYFYVLLQIPIYEFLPALGAIVAALLSLKKPETRPEQTTEEIEQENEKHINLHTLLGYWTVTSIIAFSIAGEKMPWLTFHMALPMILWAGWGLGKIVDETDWEGIRNNRGLLVLIALVVFITSLASVMMTAFSAAPPFQGKELVQLQASATFILALVGALGSGWALFSLTKDWEYKNLLRLIGLSFFALLAFLTARTTIRANYINYDNAKEYLVYAHSYTGVKDVLKQVTEISQRTTGGMGIVVAYDDDVPWPYSWYLRDFPNQKFYGNTPTRDLRNVPVIIVGDNNFTKIEPIVGQAYYRFDYIRMVWPNQDYFNLNWERIKTALTDAQLRAGIFNIWLNRDYTLYSEAVKPYAGQYFDPKVFTLEGWSPSDRMRLYVRKDIAAQIWNFGVGPVAETIQADPYEKGTITLNADYINDGTASGLAFNAPRGIAVAKNGSIYLADSRNHRIVHLAADGQFISAWGSFSDGAGGIAPLGSFNEPWGVAVGPDGSVYVTDTWNHRVQKFSAEGAPITSWGQYGQPDVPNSFYGPRGIAVDQNGHVYIADTGNKRIVVYDENGTYITEFGGAGYEPGKFDEPVDVAIDAIGNVYVSDTWNQRVQVFAPGSDGKTFLPIRQWDVNGWVSQNTENKPYIAVDKNGNVFVTDPEYYRVIEFDREGNFIRTWGSYGNGADGFGLASGIEVDAQGKVWVTDAANNRLMRFSMP